MNNKLITIGNFHGLWVPGDKSDNYARECQAEALAHVRDSIEGGFILGGDFNLGITNPSLRLIEGEMRNLVVNGGFTSTRSSFYEHEGKYADFVMVSPEIAVKRFEVMQDEVSDHLPLEIIFEV